MNHALYKRCCAALFFGAWFLAASCNPQHSSTPNQPAAQNSSATKSPARQDSYDFAAIDSLLERAAPSLGGCALVLIKDDQIIYRKSFGGFAADKVVPIASASKWLSGALIMTLVDEGKISLDDSVSKYLPLFANEKSNITIRHLFAHTSGLPAEARCRNDKRTTLERCADEIAGMKVTANPGEQFYYGGASMHVGGRIAEVVSGKTWQELFAEKIAGPVGMSKTDFLAYGPTANPRPEGDARSSADDYGRFLMMILQGGNIDGKRILSPGSIVEMHKDLTGGARIAYTIYEKHGGRAPHLLQARYGVGVWREKIDEGTQRVLETSSQGALGFSPWIDAERNLAGVLSVQNSFSGVMPFYLQLKEEIRRIVPPSDNALDWQ